MSQIGLAQQIVEMLSQYPFSEFEIKGADGTHLSGGKSSLLLASACPSMFEYFDFEVLYIGQSYGVEGSRTAPERLASHSTLQGIYAEAQRRTPDQEIWITLVSFEEWLLATFDGRKDQTIETRSNRTTSTLMRYSRVPGQTN